MERRHLCAHGPFRRAIWLARRAIVAAKLHRLRAELLCHGGVSVEDYAKPVADAARWPQPPLILGDKWDF
jgi:hypothetical protein